jgi:hypothetical protein
MQKIPTLFVRDPNDRAHVTDEVTPGCEWVLDGEGVPTRKYDGTCVMVDDDGEWWARREVKAGKTSPDGFVEVEHDETTGKRVGWVPIYESPFYKFWLEAWTDIEHDAGTYELCGPKINGNPEGFGEHRLIPHGDDVIEFDYDLRTFEDFKNAMWNLGADGWEGIVWHHRDGRMAKLKVRDFR